MDILYGPLWGICALLLGNVLSIPTLNKIHTVEIGSVTLQISNERVLNRPCEVHNQTYAHGETFLLDCRTQCACQNGRYGCSTLCPQEALSPRCRHPRLLDLPGHCCRQWLCDPPPQPAQQRPPMADDQTLNQGGKCEPKVSRWTDCTAQCGTGLSHRESNLNALCEQTTETRICQERRCWSEQNIPQVISAYHHHIRRGHECKATQRVTQAVHFRFGDCRSRKHFRPKLCGSCSVAGVCCRPQLSTTVRVEFVCSAPAGVYGGLVATDADLDVILENVQLGADLWDTEPASDGAASAADDTARTLSVNVQWILKCVCAACEKPGDVPSQDGGVTPAPGSELVLHRVHRTAPP